MSNCIAQPNSPVMGPPFPPISISSMVKIVLKIEIGGGGQAIFSRLKKLWTSLPNVKKKRVSEIALELLSGISPIFYPIPVTRHLKFSRALDGKF